MLTRKIGKYSLRIFLLLILPLICIEVLMIGLDQYLFKGFFGYDPDLGFRVRPYAPHDHGCRSNKFGFNAKDYPLQKTPGTFRILVVGDSFNWAGGCEGNYTALLGRMMENYYGYHRIDVISAGYPMTHTGEQLAMLKKFGLQYNPDLVILGFFVGNDFFDADPNRKRIVVNDLYIDIDKRHEHRILGYPIIPQSRLLLFVYKKYKVLKKLREAEREAENRHFPKEQHGTMSETRYLHVERAHLEFFNLNSFREGRFQPNINYILQCISEMDTLLKSRNFKFVVAIYPDEFQINRTLLKTIFEKFSLNQKAYDLDLAQKILRSFLESRSIPCIDLTDQFRVEGQNKDLYKFRDTHWNKAGNQLAADILFKDLVKRIDKNNPSQ